MDWRWNWIGSLLWNLLIHAVTLQWHLVGGDLDAIKGWLRSFWGEIENRVNAVRSWAGGRISWLQGYAFGLYVQAINWINTQVNSIRSWAQGQLSWLRGYAFGLYVQAVNWINSQIGWVRSWAQSLVNAVYAWARPYVDYWIGWVRGLYEWIQPYRDLVTRFLVGARAVIEWLWYQAWGQLQAFLRDPIGFVLGWLLTPVRNLINWWNRYGVGLMNFVAEDLPRLRNLLAAGYALLRNLVDHPAEFILDLLAPVILEWLARRITEEW